MDFGTLHQLGAGRGLDLLTVMAQTLGHNYRGLRRCPCCHSEQTEWDWGSAGLGEGL